MLGGSVYIAFIRFSISLAGVILLFSGMSESRFGKKKTFFCYMSFSVVVLVLTCIWYVLDRESCIRIAAFAMYMCFMVVGMYISRDSVYLSLYKLALIFYLLAVFLIGGIEVAIHFFDRNIWADIIMRMVLIALMYLIFNKKLKNDIRDFGDYVEKEVDRFSVAVMIVCILFGIGFIMNPNLKIETPFRLYQIITNFVLTGTLQLVMFRLYLHVGKEKEYERENQLIQMNHRLLERQLEIMEESVESGKRIRHDVRHHNAVIAEYICQGQYEELRQYIKEYDEEMDRGRVEKLCANVAVNNLLCAYTRRARNAEIKVTLDIELGRELTIPDIDLVAIIANAYENAIYGCMAVQRQEKERECSIHFMIKRKKNKLVIFCSNTCRKETELKDGKPKAEFTGGVGVSSITRTAEKYEGKYDFKNDNGIFVFRLIMNIPPEHTTEKEVASCTGLHSAMTN